jgi:hypothetical protein
MATPTTLPATFVAANPLPAASLNNLRGAFRILQVVQGTPYSTIVSNTTTTMVDTGLTATITCQSNTSKVLIVVQQTFGKNSANVANAVRSQIVSGTTAIHVFQGAALYTGTLMDLVGPSTSAVYLDNPTTTAAITYKTQFANFSASNGVSANTNNAVATITLLEISA